MVRHNLHLVWFAHQPFFIPDAELVDRVHSTYIPIVDIHVERQIPISLGITGGTLERISKLVPEFISSLKDAMADGWIDCIETAAFHPLLPELDRYWVNKQIEYDKKIKRTLGISTVPVFWPTELAWSNRLAEILIQQGYKYVVIDSSCVNKRNSWPNWATTDKRLVSRPPISANVTRHSKLSLKSSVNGRKINLDVITRNGSVANELVSILHDNRGYADKLAPFLEVLGHEARLSYDPLDIVVLGEDPERILPERLGEYLIFLDQLHEQGTVFHKIKDILDKPSSDSAIHIPAGTMQGDANIWSSSLEDRWYRRQLDDVCRNFLHWRSTANGPEVEAIERQIMQIQDSGFYFWPYIARTRTPFYEAISRIEMRMKILN